MDNRKTRSAIKKISWIDKLIIWIDQLPFPAWLFYIIIILAGEFLLNLVFWMDGSVPYWQYITLQSISFPLVILGLVFYHYLTKAGSKALQDFRPLLEAADDEIVKIDRELNYLPAWLNWVVLIWAVVGSTPYLFGSANLFGDIAPQTNLPITFVYIATVITVCPFLYQTFRIVRQVRIIQDLYQQISNLNLLHLEPAHAFARLTASTGGGLILLMVAGTLYNPELRAGVNAFGFFIMISFGIFIFVIPLIGMRNRLITEKVQRLEEISQLLQLSIDQIHSKVREQDNTDMLEAKSAMEALIEERTLIEKISTWPWDTGTIRGFSSTLLLPIVLWFITRLLERYF